MPHYCNMHNCHSFHPKIPLLFFGPNFHESFNRGNKYSPLLWSPLDQNQNVGSEPVQSWMACLHTWKKIFYKRSKKFAFTLEKSLHSKNRPDSSPYSPLHPDQFPAKQTSLQTFLWWTCFSNVKYKVGQFPDRMWKT